MNTEPMIRRRDLQKALGLSSETVRRWLIDGKLPKPDIYITDSSSWWRNDTLIKAGFDLLPALAEASQPKPASS